MGASPTGPAETKSLGRQPKSNGTLRLEAALEAQQRVAGRPGSPRSRRKDDRKPRRRLRRALLPTGARDLLEYLVTLAMARRTGALPDTVLRIAAWETQPARASALESASAAGDARVAEVRKRLARVASVPR